MLKTQYAGLELKNPIIAASSGLTDNVEKIVALEKAGVGAVVLKSLFEEQLAAQSEHLLNSSDSDYPEAYDYLQNIVKAHEVEKYLTLIREARKAVSIPVIASINCYDDGSWESFAADLEKAGASAIELNVQKINPTTEYRPGTIGRLHVEILQKVEAAVHIPVTADHRAGKTFSSDCGTERGIHSVNRSDQDAGDCCQPCGEPPGKPGGQ